MPLDYESSIADLAQFLSLLLTSLTSLCSLSCNPLTIAVESAQLSGATASAARHKHRYSYLRLLITSNSSRDRITRTSSSTKCGCLPNPLSLYEASLPSNTLTTLSS